MFGNISKQKSKEQKTMQASIYATFLKLNMVLNKFFYSK